MDVRLSSEQEALREAAAQVVERLGPKAVAQLGEPERLAKLDAAVDASGWRELRAASDDGAPWASGVEVALVAEELGRGLAEVSFLGPTLAAELRRLAGAPPAERRETVVLDGSWGRLAGARDGVLEDGAVAVDAAEAASGLVLVDGPGGSALGEVPISEVAGDVDLTRPVATWGARPSVRGVEVRRVLRADDVTRWANLATATSCADLVGVMRGAVELACDYARVRRQYGMPIGAFQAVQHLLADACVAMEGSRSIARHAAWAVDARDPAEAQLAVAMAKAYCARAARSVCETAIQVHGGIGNTWDCLAHVYLRRALFSIEAFGGIGPSLARVLAGSGIGGDDGLR